MRSHSPDVTGRRERPRLSPAWACAAALLLGLAGMGPWRPAAAAGAAAPVDLREVRALWVQRSSLTSRESIARLVDEARTARFNTLLVQVRGRGDAYFADGVDPRAPALAGQPASFDPLATVLAAARGAGLRVHAWVNMNLVADATSLPSARTHIVQRHPEWLMVPRALAGDLARVDPRNPSYLGQLARHARAEAARVEGLYLSPLHEGAAAYTVSVIADLVERYDVDGVHLDYIRYPNDTFDYGPAALALFRLDVMQDLGDDDRQRYDARLAAEPAIYADAFPDRWQTFRRDRLTALVTRVREVVKARRPAAILSAAVLPDAREAFTHRLQDWPRWAETGLLDAVCPMAYTTDADTFRAQIASVQSLAAGRPVWAGIGAYRLSSSETIENILAARAAGARGIVLFSYDNLTAQPGRAQVLSDIGRAAFDY
jgi:uncharacterized lipoprotein YddW (UPF0748 family)